MKKITMYILPFMILIATSCSSDFIDLSPISNPSAELFYKTPKDFETAVVGAYSNLSKPSQYGSDDNRFGGAFYTMMEVRGDDATDGKVSSGTGLNVYNIDNFISNPLNTLIEDAWTSIFKTIFDANSIITRIEKTDIDEDVKTKYIAEARFLRGLSYFNAVRLWGRLPLILKEITPEEAKTFGRSDIADVYNAIEEDFIYASEKLPSKNYLGATSGAAKAFLGKVYLTEKKWSDASRVLQGVVNDGNYELLPDISDVFDLNNEGNSEILFAVYFSDVNKNVGNKGFGTPELAHLLSLYEDGDTRASLLEDTDADGVLQKLQYSHLPSGKDFILLRYSDVLLMLSEALNEQGFSPGGLAFTYLNQVRHRAGLGDATASSQNEFRQAVLLERRLEFPTEFSRWFDLLRTDNAIKAFSEKNKTIEPYQLLYPIPQNEINIYNDKTLFPQNEGYY